MDRIAGFRGFRQSIQCAHIGDTIIRRMIELGSAENRI
jgi:hypothetical protein